MTRLAISIQARGDGLDAAMDPRFGRAPRYVLIDPDDEAGAAQVVDNPSFDAPHGAGTGAAALMKDLAVSSVISGRVGPKALQVLDALEIEAWIAPPGMTAGEALAAHRAGRLERMAMREFR